MKGGFFVTTTLDENVLDGKSRTGQKFGLRELGLTDGPPLRGARTVVETARELLGSHVTFFVFDDLAACARVHVSTNPKLTGCEFPIAHSLCAQVRVENKVLAYEEIAGDALEASESWHLEAHAFLGAPVFGPDPRAVGVLTAMHASPRSWTGIVQQRLDNFAHLISQEIMLRASFETLKIMWKEHNRQNA